MAENKKSVLLYCDIIHTVEGLTDEEAGKLFKHYLRYINDLDPVSDDRLITLLFEPIKQNLKRDLKKWEQKSERNSKIAKEGWVKRKKANASERIKTYAKDADKDKVIVKDKDKDNVKDKIEKRKAEFKNSLSPFKDKIEIKDLKEFFEYWTEHGANDKKMRFEKEKSFSIERRISTWIKNKQKWNKENKSKPFKLQMDDLTLDQDLKLE